MSKIVLLKLKGEEVLKQYAKFNQTLRAVELELSHKLKTAVEIDYVYDTELEIVVNKIAYLYNSTNKKLTKRTIK
ncbi:hypothetical protein LCGC14_1027120 [marine sediment metagenome]|uniref:Uncharacterized protein n=1 Tax=marine sediment metagenome TaxID=412755 RepID=A0A0F9NHH2_9ZZZZ